MEPGKACHGAMFELGKKKKKKKKTQDIPPSCLQWAVMGTGLAGPHKFPRDPFTLNLFCREGAEPLSRQKKKNLRSTRIWNADQQILTQPKIVYSSDTLIWLKKKKKHGLLFDSSVALQALKSLLIRSGEPCFSAVPGPIQWGVRSSSVFTFLILLKVFVLVLHYSVTIFTTNFLFFSLSTPAKSSTSLASPIQKLLYFFFLLFKCFYNR